MPGVHKALHLTAIPLAPFDNLRTFSSIEAGDLYDSYQNDLEKYGGIQC
jgi:hypothetical protein